MNAVGLNLLIPEGPDSERDAVARAFESAGGTAVRVGRFWEPPSLPTESVRVYGNETFCLVLQEKLGLTLATPADDLTTTMDIRLLRRRVRKHRLDEVLRATFPLFVKSLIPKQIQSQVYDSPRALADACNGMPPDTGLITSDPVRFVAEARSFVLRRDVLDVALYEGDAPLASARTLIQSVVGQLSEYIAVVVDVGLLADGTWALVEFNAAWGAGLNGCDASLVLPAIVAASTPHPSRFALPPPAG